MRPTPPAGERLCFPTSTTATRSSRGFCRAPPGAPRDARCSSPACAPMLHVLRAQRPAVARYAHWILEIACAVVKQSGGSSSCLDRR